MKQERKSFPIYYNFYNQFKLLSMKERGELITAIFEYASAGKEEKELSPLVNMAFSCMKDTLDRDREKYERTCEQNSENGKMGGRPKKPSADIFSEKTDRFFEKAKKADNDKEKEKEKEKEKDNDSDKDRGKDRGKDSEIESDTLGNSQNAPLISEPVEAAPRSAEPFCHAPQSPPSAPLTREEEKRILIDFGIPPEYIEEREERAEEYAIKQKKSFVAVFMEWWAEDKSSYERKRMSEKRSGAYHSSEKSYDTDDFFEASLRRAFEEFDDKYGKYEINGVPSTS